MREYKTLIEPGKSKWVLESKNIDDKLIAVAKPLLCDCGYKRKIGKSGEDVASFFYVGYEYICLGCGKVLG